MVVKGFMLTNGQEIIGGVKDITDTHYVLEDVVGISVKHGSVLGQVSVGFMPLSVLAETAPGKFTIPELRVPMSSVLFDYHIKDNMMQNYISMRSNLVVASSITDNMRGALN